MSGSDARIAKLKQLMHDEFDGKQVSLANKLGRQPDYISRLFNGRKGLGEELARDFESLLGKPKYWLDGDVVPNVAIGPDIRGSVPLISWVRAGEFCEIHNPFEPGDAEKWLSCPVAHGPNTYCLRVVGRSMDNGENGFREGEILFVDPDAEPLPGRNVIVRTQEGTCTFKQLKQDEDGLYLLALNPSWENRYIKMPEGAHICGVVIFSGREW